MGRDSTGTAWHEGNSYYGEIKPEWLEDDADWNLELHDIPKELEADGTHIRVGQLYEGIAKQFDQESSNFLVDLTAPFQNWW